MRMNYSDFLDRKTQLGCDHGFEPSWMPSFLFDFQKSLGRVLILTPLAVAFQTVKEGEKFGIEVKHRRDGLQAARRLSSGAGCRQHPR